MSNLFNFIVSFSGTDLPSGKDLPLKIVAPDHARATEWSLLQLKTWGCKKCKFEVKEESEQKKDTKDNKKSETKQKTGERKNRRKLEKHSDSEKQKQKQTD